MINRRILRHFYNYRRYTLNGPQTEIMTMNSLMVIRNLYSCMKYYITKRQLRLQNIEIMRPFETRRILTLSVIDIFFNDLKDNMPSLGYLGERHSVYFY